MIINLLNKVKFPLIVSVIILVILVLLGNQILETTQVGFYKVKQAPYFGTLSVHKTPGTFWQLFGDIYPWKFAESYTFGELDRDNHADASSSIVFPPIEVRFNDGSLTHIHGSCRVIMPSSDEQILQIQGEYTNNGELVNRLIAPHVSNCLRLTANLMTARESYSEKRQDFLFWSWDQIENGLYRTEPTIIDATDEVTGLRVRKEVKMIKRGTDGNPVYEENPFEGTGITLKNFEVAVFDYPTRVQEQISMQQEAYMAVETAKAETAKAEEDAKKIEMQGKADVTTAQYEMEQVKIKEVVTAEKEKEVAELQAQKELEVERLNKEKAEVEANKKLEVAKLDKDAAEFEKQAEILRGEGIATAKELVMRADGALQVKGEILNNMVKSMADAIGKREVPKIFITSGGSEDGVTSQDTHIMQMFEALLASGLSDKLGLDLSLPKSDQTIINQ